MMPPSSLTRSRTPTRGAETAGVEATGEDSKVGALVVPTMTMIMATKGGDKDKDKIILSQERVVGQDGKNGGYGEAMGLAYSGCGGVGVGGPLAGQHSNGSNALTPSQGHMRY
jgi:hypothetical protein